MGRLIAIVLILLSVATAFTFQLARKVQRSTIALSSSSDEVARQFEEQKKKFRPDFKPVQDQNDPKKFHETQLNEAPLGKQFFAADIGPPALINDYGKFYFFFFINNFFLRIKLIIIIIILSVCLVFQEEVMWVEMIIKMPCLVTVLEVKINQRSPTRQ